MPFEFLEGYTYEITGSKSVEGKTDRPGWSKRQATVLLTIFADGEWRVNPLLIFHGQGTVYEKEKPFYHPDVTVRFNETAYNNEQLFLEWIESELKPALVREKENLLVMDVASFHKTSPVKDKLKSMGVTTALIPPGMTCLLQPLDTAVNSLFKRLLEEETDIYTTEWERQHPDQKWSVKDKRILSTYVVARACYRLITDKKDIVVKSFVHTGISIRPDGSEDDLISLKGISKDQINFTGWETENDPKIKLEDYEELPSFLDTTVEVTLNGEHLISQGHYDLLPKPVQKALCKSRGLKVSGNKTELASRLAEYDRKTLANGREAARLAEAAKEDQQQDGPGSSSNDPVLVS